MARRFVVNEDDRRTDSVRLVASTTTFSSGDRYRQLSPELHSSRQAPGTVTRVQFGFLEPRELTVCLTPGGPWVCGRARPATHAR